MKSSIALITLVGFSFAHRARQEDNKTPLESCKVDLCSSLSQEGNKNACADFCTSAIQLNNGLTKANDEERTEALQSSLRDFVGKVRESGDENDFRVITDLGLVGDVEAEI